MNKQPDGADVVFDLFREGQRFAHQSADALPERVVHPFDVRGAARFFAAWSMAFPGQDGGIRGPEIRVRDRTLAVHSGQRVPQLLRGDLIARPNRHPHNFAGVAIQGQPNPLLGLFGFDKGPEFVAFQRQSAFFFGWTATALGTAAYLLLT